MPKVGGKVVGNVAAFVLSGKIFVCTAVSDTMIFSFPSVPKSLLGNVREFFTESAALVQCEKWRPRCAVYTRNEVLCVDVCVASQRVHLITVTKQLVGCQTMMNLFVLLVL